MKHNSYREKDRRKSIAKEFAKDMLIIILVSILLFVLDGKAEACGKFSTECVACALSGAAL